MEWRQLLACPRCNKSLAQHEAGFICDACPAEYPRQHHAITFIETDLTQTSDARAMVAGYRKPNRIVTAIRRVISSEYFPGKGWRAARDRVLAAEAPILVIGSGITQYPNAIHLDLDDFPGVDLVADAHHLPLRDNSVNGVLCEVVLEHVPDPRQVIAEAFRVLKPGGRFFFIVPFVFPYHGHPSDYRRWTREGLARAFSAFTDLEIGIHGGPCSSMVNLLSEWAYLLSGLRHPRGYVPIKGLATALLFPIKYLDLVVNRFPEAHRLASTLFVTGKK